MLEVLFLNFLLKLNNYIAVPLSFWWSNMNQTSEVLNISKEIMHAVKHCGLWFTFTWSWLCECTTKVCFCIFCCFKVNSGLYLNVKLVPLISNSMHIKVYCISWKKLCWWQAPSGRTWIGPYIILKSFQIFTSLTKWCFKTMCTSYCNCIGLNSWQLGTVFKLLATLPLKPAFLLCWFSFKFKMQSNLFK